MRVVSALTPALFAVLAYAAPAHAVPDPAPYPAAQQNSPCGKEERADNETDALNCRSLDHIQARLAAMAQARAPQGSVIAAGTGMVAPESITTPQLPGTGHWYSSSERP
ncbi:MAG: hypothetical protein ABF888_02185 [Acetobacter papayae]